MSRKTVLHANMYTHLTLVHKSQHGLFCLCVEILSSRMVTNKSVYTAKITRWKRLIFFAYFVPAIYRSAWFNQTINILCLHFLLWKHRTASDVYMTTCPTVVGPTAQIIGF